MGGVSGSRVAPRPGRRGRAAVRGHPVTIPDAEPASEDVDQDGGAVAAFVGLSTRVGLFYASTCVRSCQLTISDHPRPIGENSH